MGYYGDDRDHSFPRAIIPEDPAGARCFLLGVGFEDFFTVWPLKGSKFVRVQRGMPQVGLKQSEAFPDGFKDIPLRGVVLKLAKVSIGLGTSMALLF